MSCPAAKGAENLYTRYELYRFGLRDFNERQLEGKGCALAFHTLYSNLLAMSLEYLLDDAEAEARATRLARPVRLHSIETVKNPFEVFRRHPLSGIPDRAVYLFALFGKADFN